MGWFKKKPVITPEWLVNEQGFKRKNKGVKECYTKKTKSGVSVEIFPYVTESVFDFFWTVNDRLLPDLNKDESDRIETVLNNY